VEGSLIGVLIVTGDEDEYLLVDHALKRVASRGYATTWVTDVDVARDELAAGGYEVALVARNLGPSSGLELLHVAARSGVDTSIILLDDRWDHRSEHDARGAGAADVLTRKGITPRVLERSVRYAVERHHANKARGAHRRLLKEIFDSAEIGMALVDQNDLLLACNPAWCRMMDHEETELLGSNALERIHRSTTQTPPHSEAGGFAECEVTADPGAATLAAWVHASVVNDRSRRRSGRAVLLVGRKMASRNGEDAYGAEADRAAGWTSPRDDDVAGPTGLALSAAQVSALQVWARPMLLALAGMFDAVTAADGGPVAEVEAEA
jgi:PAS domain-containing protein